MCTFFVVVFLLDIFVWMYCGMRKEQLLEHV